jgi:thiol-disulfide isomerase/thioredoxin
MHNDAPLSEMPEPVSETPEPAKGGMNTRTKAWIGTAAVLVALVMLAMLPGTQPIDQDAPPPAADQATEDAATGSLVGKPAPMQFTLKDMDGVDVKLTSFSGKVIILNFWATWCGPCRLEIPSLIELQKQYSNDLVVLGVSIDDTPEKLRPYAKEFKVNYPLLVGNGRQDFQDAYGPFYGIPVSVFVGRDGKITKKHSGIATKEQFEQEIKSLL